MEVINNFLCFISRTEGENAKTTIENYQSEYQEKLARLWRMKGIGVSTGSVCGASPEPDRLAVEQTEDECAWICELPSGGIAFVGPAELTVGVPGTLIRRAQVVIRDFDCELELSDPGESLWYAQLMKLMPYNLTKCLNHWLISGVPLSVRQERGAIIAEGWASVPAKLHDYAPVSAELVLRDARDNDFQFNFRARVNRDLMWQYKRQQLEHRERMRPTGRTGIFGPKTGQVGSQQSVSSKVAINRPNASGEDDRELRKPN
jgi:hypothetical protein